MNSLLLDISTALRFFSRRRSAFVVIVVTMALALGANTAVFSVLKAFLFSNLAVPEPERVVLVWTTRDLPGRGRVDFSDSYPNYQLLARTTHSFSSIATTLPTDVNWERPGDTRRLQGLRATAGFFEVMHLRTELGRFFTSAEEGPRAAPVAVISHALWQSAFGGAQSVIGRTLRFNGAPHTIIGVVPRDFSQPVGTDVWLPFDLPDNLWASIVGGRQLNTYARLSPGVTLSAANNDLCAFAAIAIEADAANKDWSWRVQPLREVQLEGADHALLFIQGGAVILLVLAACNLASLLLAWAAERQRETALKMALGASGGRLMQQFLVQSVTLVAIGGGLGVLFAELSLPIFRELNPNPALASLLTKMELDRGTLAFAAAIILGTGLLAGLIPAWQSRRVSFLEALRTESRGASISRGALRWQKAMVVLQSAVSVLILIGAVLAMLGFQKLSRVRLGFAATNRVVLHFQLSGAAYATHGQRAQFVRGLEDNLRHEPALAAFGVTSTLPVGDIQWGGGFSPELSGGEFARDPSLFHFRRVTPSYLATMGVPLTAGRMLNERDDGNSPAVAVVSESLARKYWPGGSALGRKLKRATPNTAPPVVEIVGVVGDVHDAGAGVPAGETVYVPFAQQSMARSWIVLQTKGSIDDAVVAGRKALRATDPGIAAYGISRLDELAWQADALIRLEVTLLSVFATIALGITGLGSYGVMSQLATNRRQEMGIRAALGATQGGVLRLILWQNARLAALGTAAGLVCSWFCVRVLQAHLSGFDASPLWPYVAVAGAIIALTQLASLVPAYRAAKLAPHLVLGSC